MSNRLYVGNLPFHATDDLLSQYFAASGGVTSVSVVIDRETGRSRGFAFIDMESPAAAQKAISDLDGRDMDGRPLRVRIAEDRKPGGGGGGGFRGGGGGGRGGQRGR